MTPETAVIRKALAAVCGDVRDGDPAEGTLMAAPGSTEEAAAVMRVAAEHELAVVARGGGSRLSWGDPAVALRPGHRHVADVRRGGARGRGPGRPCAGRGADGRRRGRARAGRAGDRP